MFGFNENYWPTKNWKTFHDLMNKKYCNLWKCFISQSRDKAITQSLNWTFIQNFFFFVLTFWYVVKTWGRWRDDPAYPVLYLNWACRTKRKKTTEESAENNELSFHCWPSEQGETQRNLEINKTPEVANCKRQLDKYFSASFHA